LKPHATTTARSVTLDEAMSSPAPMSFALQPPVLQRQQSDAYGDTTPLRLTSAKMPLREVDVQAFMRQLVCSTPDDSKKHARPCPRSPILKPQVLQPRIRSSFSFTNEFCDLKNVTRPPAVCCYSGPEDSCSNVARRLACKGQTQTILSLCV